MTIEEVKKRCSRCKAIKPISDFSNKKANRGGKNTQCKDCVREARTGRVNIQAPPAKIDRNCMKEWWV